MGTLSRPRSILERNLPNFVAYDTFDKRFRPLFVEIMESLFITVITMAIKFAFHFRTIWNFVQFLFNFHFHLFSSPLFRHKFGILYSLFYPLYSSKSREVFYNRIFYNENFQVNSLLVCELP